MARGVKHVPAFEASVLILLEPAMNPVWTYLFHNERPGPLALAGGVIIMGATVGVMLLYVFSMVLSLFGATPSFLTDSSPLGIGLSVVICGIAALNRLAKPLRESEVAFHGDDAGTDFCHHAGAAQQIDIVAGRGLDEIEVAFVLPREFADEGEGAAMQETAADTERGAVGHARREFGEADDFFRRLIAHDLSMIRRARRIVA